MRAICEHNIQVIVLTRKLFTDAPSLRRRLSKAVLNVEEDILVSKVCQNFPIGDFYLDIATLFTAFKERSQLKIFLLQINSLAGKNNLCLFVI